MIRLENLPDWLMTAVKLEHQTEVLQWITEQNIDPLKVITPVSSKYQLVLFHEEQHAALFKLMFAEKLQEL